MAVVFKWCTCLIMALSASATRTYNKIYINLKTKNACVRILNATHQAGCSSAIGGNIGIVHYVQTGHDLDWVLAKGPHSPYVVAINSSDFNGSIANYLILSERINGIMIIRETNMTNDSSYPAAGFSSVDSCPNDRYGLYYNTTFKDCNMLTWNPTGTSLLFKDVRIPLFELSDEEDVKAVLETCFRQFNSNSSRYPMCAAEVKTKMSAAVDSVTCLRRSSQTKFTLMLTRRIYCSPFQDKNVVVTMNPSPLNETREERSIILITTKMDAASMFEGTHYAADTTLVGIVTLLATAEALWKVSDVIRKNETAKDIMFAFLQGETFDYIGSSRIVYDMNQGKFPMDYGSDNDTRTIRLEHINQILELTQVGLRDNGVLWAHTDPLTSNKFISEKNKMINHLIKIGETFNVTLSVSDHKMPLPPSSVQRFLRSNSDIPVLVIGDHYSTFKNKYYNSQFDTAYLVGADNYPAEMAESMKYDFVTWQAKLITNLSSTLAQYLFTASMGQFPTDELKKKLTADTSTVTHLLYCFIRSVQCELFAESFKEEHFASLRQPLTFFVGADANVNDVTYIVRNLLVRFTGSRMKFNEQLCITRKEKNYSHYWMQGNMTTTNTREGWCFKSNVVLTDALSPAFVIRNYDMMSGEYSTWTESTWGSSSIYIRLFLLPSKEYEMVNFYTGLIMFLLSLMAAQYIASKADLIFTIN